MRQFLVEQKCLKMANEEVSILIFLQLLGIPGNGVDQGKGREVSWHFGILSFHDLKVVGLHGLLKSVEGLGVYFG